MRCNLYREVIHKSHHAIEVGTLMGSRRLMVMQKVQLKNAIRSFLKTYGIRLGSIGDARFIEKVKRKLSDELTLLKESIEGLLMCYERVYAELKKLTKKVEELAGADEDVKRFMTIPGVGPITALAYKMEIDDPKKFK